MQHFFVKPSSINGDTVIIEGEDVNHIKNVLRMKIGDEISISNGVDDNDYRVGIEEIKEDCIVCKLRFIKQSGVELPAKVWLFQGLPKSDKMELIIQKAVELGASYIVPVDTKRSVVKLDEKKASSKIARWQSISEAAAKQSKRAIIPTVKDVCSFKEAVSMVKDFNSKVIPYELKEGMEGTKDWLDKIKDLLRSNCSEEIDIAVFIGPEGGFDEDEIKMAEENEVIPISLGRRILRTETAGMTVLSILMYNMEII